VFSWGHEQCSKTSGLITLAYFYYLKDLKHVYYVYCDLPYGKEDKMLLIDGVATPLWAKCEDETHILKSGNFESSEIPENSDLKFKGQNTLHSSVRDVIGKVLKFRCPKWPRINHLDIYSPSYGQKKGRESNCQFDSRPLKVGNRHLPDVCSRSATWR
jgi:hypothetical protein